MNTRAISRLFSLPITRQLRRLNDNIESIMRVHGIRVPADPEPKRDVVEFSTFDDEAAAVAEFEERMKG
jgi:hypothetical protein